jgi:hypothetical protein
MEYYMSSGLEHVVSEDTEDGPELSGNGYQIQPMVTHKASVDDKYFKKFIKAVESLIRRSNEYRDFVAHILSDGSQSCAFFQNITSEEATVEVHHHPLTLYEIVEIVAEKKFLEEIPITTYDIADEVLKLHWDNKVGVVVLSKTVHELVHQGDIFIGIDKVLGRVAEFAAEHEEGFNEIHLAKIEKLIEDTRRGRVYSERAILESSGQRMRVAELQFAEAELSATNNGILIEQENESEEVDFDEDDIPF